jgi:hypothetical protein
VDPIRPDLLAASDVDQIHQDLSAVSALAVDRIPRDLLAVLALDAAMAQGCCGNRRSIRMQSITEQNENLD